MPRPAIAALRASGRRARADLGRDRGSRRSHPPSSRPATGAGRRPAGATPRSRLRSRSSRVAEDARRRCRSQTTPARAGSSLVADLRSTLHPGAGSIRRSGARGQLGRPPAEARDPSPYAARRPSGWLAARTLRRARALAIGADSLGRRGHRRPGGDRASSTRQCEPAHAVAEAARDVRTRRRRCDRAIDEYRSAAEASEHAQASRWARRSSPSWSGDPGAALIAACSRRCRPCVAAAAGIPRSDPVRPSPLGAYDPELITDPASSRGRAGV